MVLINRNQQPPVRRQTSTGIPDRRNTSSRCSSTTIFSCAMGDDDGFSTSSLSSHRSGSRSSSTSFTFVDSLSLSSSILSNGSVLPSTTHFSRMTAKASSTTPLSNWSLPFFYALTLFSWIRAIQYRSSDLETLSAFNSEFESLVAQKSYTWNLLKEARKNRDAIAEQQKTLKNTQRLFGHEMRMIEELYEVDTLQQEDLAVIPPETMDKYKNRKSAGVAVTWIGHRQEALLHKIYSLQAFIQEESRQRILQKYGPGPHRVHFHVLSREGRKPGDLIVEMASIDKMPHSIEAFLDMVSNKMWDNSVFYHHFTHNHVVAAAPVAYGTFQPKQHHFQALGFNGVSFPEYHKSYPHERYSIGFAGRGPNFYINTMDNTEHHGPGGQNHHDLATDADPCFGKIISGYDVLDTDMMTGRHKKKNPSAWEDFDLTRIATVELLTNPVPLDD